MSGDCGHGWGYHSKGASGPCDLCEKERQPAQEPVDVTRDPRVLLAACLLNPLPLALTNAIKEVLAAPPASQPTHDLLPSVTAVVSRQPEPAQEPALRLVVSVDESGTWDRHHFDMTWLQTPSEAGEYLYYTAPPADTAVGTKLYATPPADTARQDRILTLCGNYAMAYRNAPIAEAERAWKKLEREVRKP